MRGNTQGEIPRVVEPEGRALLREWKRRLLDRPDKKEITELYLSGVGYRQIRAVVESRIESGVGLTSL